ncbi:NMDA receptor-regulated protein 1-domain-containing protein [Umbelopsis sp. AD052]|nr:NMDA receptor-regulated protein 1-domain-containing protein [Umbelopsis sp. AD052]
MNAKRELPAKENAIFKNILRNYEHKQYKKGLKLADTILKKFPEHGETLAMKGLFLNNLEKKEEGYEFVKKGLRFDLTSHICWHVFGLLYRSDKNYEEAAKCYTHALKYNKSDMQILRDFALLQTQMRHYDALIETRTQLLQAKPTNPPFWIGVALAYQLVGKYDIAIQVLEAHESALREQSVNFEQSELLMYHNSLVEESGDIEKALEHLETIEPKVCDKRAWKVKKAEFLLKLNRSEEAETAYRLLISENPDNYSYIKGLIAVKGLNSAMLKIFDDIQSDFPRSTAARNLPLNYASGDNFRNRADAYLQSALRKGVPSLFVDIKRLYSDSEKEKIVEELVTGYEISLEKTGHFNEEQDEKVVEPPTAYLWTLYFLAQHYDKQRKTELALKTIDRAIEHTPTLVELYMTKGRILKHGGDLEAAARVMNEAREMDLQDRFINSKSAKYYIRNDKIEEAEKILGLFTRPDAASPLQDLTDMQCMWLTLEEGDSYLRQGQKGKALKRYHTVDKFFSDIFDDQFDFHTYCLRKTTLRSYVDTIRFEDNLKGSHYFIRAAVGAVKAYTSLADKPNGANGMDEANMSEADKKKARNKARKAELKAQKENKPPKKEQVKEEAPKKVDVKKPTDEDPEGENYLKTTDPLASALEWVRPLEQVAPKHIQTHLLGFEIYLRKGSLLLALKALVQSWTIDKTNPQVATNIARFKEAVSANPPANADVKAVIDSQLASLA